VRTSIEGHSQPTPTSVSRDHLWCFAYRNNSLLVTFVHLAGTTNWATVVPIGPEYRAKARECEERAEQTRDHFIKKELLEIAQKWRRMAAHVEKRAR
jgi:hypothetical protein